MEKEESSYSPWSIIDRMPAPRPKWSLPHSRYLGPSQPSLLSGSSISAVDAMHEVCDAQNFRWTVLTTFTDHLHGEPQLSRLAEQLNEDNLSDRACIQRLQDRYHHLHGEVGAETAQWEEEMGYLSKRSWGQGQVIAGRHFHMKRVSSRNSLALHERVAYIPAGNRDLEIQYRTL